MAGKSGRIGALLGVVFACASFVSVSRASTLVEQARWRAEAADVTIVRDDWGIAHVSGATDAQAVFGMAYAQAEDDFDRVEANYIDALGRRAEVEGQKAIWRDLRQRLFIDEADLEARYAASPEWLKTLMAAWADGLNYYLATHLKVTPHLITRFEPWMALSFTEGSIGGDIERAPLRGIEAFYGGERVARLEPALETPRREPDGSNGIAIAPSKTVAHHALLLINPHTSFYFRSELQMTSGEGLNAYGAVTWGQFFVYQGFNNRLGWMHTSSGVDAVDEFLEEIHRDRRRLAYRHGAELRPVGVSQVTIRYRTDAGPLASRTFTVYRTDHGPVIGEIGGKWLTIALMFKPVEALEQSFLRTKARDFTSYMKIMTLKANSSNNTVFADADGDIAYLHPQFIPRRDDRFDFTKPVDGADPSTDWKGVHELSEAPRVLDPPNGWIANTNNWPYSAAGPFSPKRADYPRYMDTAGETPRGVHAQLLLGRRRDFTPASLIAAAYDPYLTAFADLIPTVIEAWDGEAASDPQKAKLAAQIAVLRAWDNRWSLDSVATSLAVLWGDELWSEVEAEVKRAGTPIYEFMATGVSPSRKLEALALVSDRLTREFGSWRVPWGQINRFQRLDGAITPHFSDDAPSIPVGFTGGRWGSLAAFDARPYHGSRRYYGTAGNSFVAVVEFSDRVRAWAVTAGGESGDPASAHFDDQARRYVAGDLRPVYFYPEDLTGHIERRYHPGA
jgi:acyl-homoserine-lactone acylase